MDPEAYRELQFLTEIASQDTVTQRSLARRYRLALGLTNFLIRRLITKGYVKVVNLERRRLRYLITPKGLAEKARLTYEYLEYSLALYRQIRTLLTRTLSTILQSGATTTVLYGTGELAEIVFLTMQQRGVQIVAVVDEPVEPGAVFMGQPVRRLSELSALTCDWLVIASFRDRGKILQQLRQHGVPAEKIVAISEEARPAVLSEAGGEPLPTASEAMLEVPSS